MLQSRHCADSLLLLVAVPPLNRMMWRLGRHSQLTAKKSKMPGEGGDIIHVDLGFFGFNKAQER